MTTTEEYSAARYARLDAAGRITRARTKLIMEQPFWGQLAMRLSVHEAGPTDVGPDLKPIRTAATDGERLIYHRDFILDLTEPECWGLVAHEVGHCALGHVWRLGERIALVWNIACDLVVNYILNEAGFVLPGAALYPPDEIAGASTERTYAWLMKQPPVQELAARACQAGGGVGGMDGQNQRGHRTRDAGSQEIDTPWGKVIDDHHAWRAKSNASAEERKLAESAWKSQVASAAAAVRTQNQGRLPAGLERLVGELLAPKVDWRTVLAQFMHALHMNDFDWRLVRKVPMAGGQRYYAPRLRSEGVRLAVAIDTSGSITNEMIQNFLSEVAGILWMLGGIEMILYFCDAEVQAVWHLGPDDPLPKTAPGGGGTSFVPVFQHIEEHMPEDPDALIYFTDSYGQFPAREPEYPVLWVVDNHTKTYNIPFGDLVEYNPEDSA